MNKDFGSPPRSAMHRSARQAWLESDGSGRADESHTDVQPSVSSYQTYPEQQPFIHDNFRRPVNKSSKALPESNRQAVMSALKSLQSKINQLELERGQAEANLRSLAVETNRYHDILHQDTSNVTMLSQGMDKSGLNTSGLFNQSASGLNTSARSQGNPHAGQNMQFNEVDGQLDDAENRCQLLERQLDYMRQLLHQSENNKADTVKRCLTEGQQRADSETRSLKMQIDKLNVLERDYLRLGATQTMAENKIRELEQKLLEERHHRKMVQDRAAQLESQTESGRILQKSLDKNNNKNRRPVKKKTKKVLKKGNKPVNPNHHYHLNLNELPFVAGKSTADSHSVPANVQKVISMMKSHSTVLCSPPGTRRSTAFHGTSSSSGVSSGGASSAEMTDLLMQLQDEFGRMSIEHQELSRQIQESHTQPLQDDLERELDNLVMRMEVKGDQISKVRRHQTLSFKKKKKRPVSARPQSACARVPLTNGVVEVRTTIKSTPEKPVQHYLQSGSTHQAKDFLKNLKKIQTTLGKDDLSWEC